MASSAKTVIFSRNKISEFRKNRIHKKRISIPQKTFGSPETVSSFRVKHPLKNLIKKVFH